MTGPTREAGRELDALVAEKVMGWRVDSFAAPSSPGSPEWMERAAPHYSTDIRAAWLVVEKLREMRQGDREMREVFRLAHCYTAEQVAAAISRAALAAIGDAS